MKYNFDINNRAFNAIKNKTKRVEIRTTKLGENHFDYGIIKSGDEIEFKSYDSKIAISGGTSLTLYAKWEAESSGEDINPEEPESIIEYKLKYSCRNGIKCKNLPGELTGSTNADYVDISIENQAPTRDDGYIFAYWISDADRYCNYQNTNTGCTDTIRITKSGTILLNAVWKKDQTSNIPDENSPIDDNEEPTNPQTGMKSAYIAIAIALSMLGYTYYYAKKLNENIK